MNPYEKTAATMKSQSEGPKRALKTGASIVGAAAGIKGIASFAPILQKAAPFLSQYIPENLAIKGLSKVSQGFGKFINGALGSGYDFSEIKDFIGEQINESKQNSPEGKNIIQQYSPELFEFLQAEMQKGRAPLEAGALAELQPNFKKIIKKMAEDHKTTFASILQTIFGQMGQPNAQQTQSQQGGNGNAMLLQAIQSINQRLGGQ